MAILKKPTLNPSLPSNYRPITISSVFTKLFEMLTLRDEEGLPLSPNQYGFRNKYSVGHGITLLNDLMCYTKTTDSNMYLCSIDAEKCFDTIWHAGLFNKLFNVLPNIHWPIL